MACGGAATDSAPLLERTVAWETEVSAGGASASLVDPQTLVFAGYDLSSSEMETSEPSLVIGRVRVESGALLWERSLEPRGATPLVTRVDDVLVVQQGSAVEAIDRSSGSYLWGVAFEGSPTQLAGANNVLVIELPDGIVNGRDARTGRHLWTIDTGDWDWREFHEVDGELYAIADRGQTEVAVFQATYPSSSPLWTADVRGGAAATWVGGSALFGRFDGIVLRRAELGSGERIGEPVAHGDGWLGSLRLISTQTEGLVLRMRRVDAFGPADDEEPRWSATLPSASALDTMELVLDDRAVFLSSGGSSVLLDARDGSVVWRATHSDEDASSPCTTLGTSGSALIQGCGLFSMTRLVAVETGR